MAMRNEVADMTDSESSGQGLRAECSASGMIRQTPRAIEAHPRLRAALVCRGAAEITRTAISSAA